MKTYSRITKKLIFSDKYKYNIEFTVWLFVYSLTLEQRELCRARKKLLQYLYRLQTYEVSDPYIDNHLNGSISTVSKKMFYLYKSKQNTSTSSLSCKQMVGIS